MNRLEKITTELKKYKQEHLLRYYDELNSEDQNSLLDEIESFDLSLVSQLHKKVSSATKPSNHIRPMTPCIYEELSEINKTDYRSIGIEALQSNKVAVILMAGGQGTRLGHDGPKGTFDIGLKSGKSLFELQADRLKELKLDHGVEVPWYIMTSYDNHDETESFFIEYDYFGLPKNKVHFFKQDQLPLTDMKGNMLLKSKHQIHKGANGNGGIFVSLAKTGVLEALKQQGIKWLFLYGVDNAIAKLADPNFIGYTIQSGLNCASKSISKASPDEKVGVFAYRNNKPGIVEYTELSENLRMLRSDAGQLIYNDANIIAHLVSMDLVDEVLGSDLPYHKAEKTYLTYDHQDELTETRGIKYELFIFDAFESQSDMALMRVKREDEFAPVKNKTGKDSPETARLLVENYMKNQ